MAIDFRIRLYVATIFRYVFRKYVLNSASQGCSTHTVHPIDSPNPSGSPRWLAPAMDPSGSPYRITSASHSSEAP
jgi:hypothetical protein